MSLINNDFLTYPLDKMNEYRKPNKQPLNKWIIAMWVVMTQIVLITAGYYIGGL